MERSLHPTEAKNLRTDISKRIRESFTLSIGAFAKMVQFRAKRGLSAHNFCHEESDYRILSLKFEDGTVVKMINVHGFYSEDENKFVFIDEKNVAVLVIQSCLTLCDSMDCSLPGSSGHGIL